MQDRAESARQSVPEADPAGYLHSIETCGTVDGPGIRYVAFLQGCPLRCLYCHNPDSWQYRSGQVYRASELVDDILKYRAFIRNGGVTLSGGEPLVQTPFVAAVFARLQARGIHTAIDTSGIVPVSKCLAALEVSNLVILDIKALDPDLCSRLTGADNRNALQMLAWCEQQERDVWIRHVVVPGYTDCPNDLEALAAYLEPFHCVRKIELLPFHQMALHKWEHLEIPYTLGKVCAPTAALMQHAKQIFRLHHLPVDSAKRAPGQS